MSAPPSDNQDLTSVFRVSLYGLVCFASVALAYAEGAALPQGLTVPLAIASLYFTERRGILQLSNYWAGALGLLAFALAGSELVLGDVEARLLSGAHLIVYLTWIALFQQKTAKQYWWMCMLSLLQVALGAVLTQRGFYGFLLLGYMFLALWTLAVFSLYLVRHQFLGSASYVSGLSSADASAAAGPGNERAGAMLRATSAAPPLRLPSRTRGAIQHEPRTNWVSPRFIHGIFWTTLLSLIVASGFFLLIPRVWIGSRTINRESLEAPDSRPLTGFTEEVQLGDMGQILESTERVLQVRLWDTETEEEIGVDEYVHRLGYNEPYFRGTVLDVYENGRWKGGSRFNLAINLSDRSLDEGVRQEIVRQPIGTRILFALHPVHGCRLKGRDGVAVMDRATAVVVRWEQKAASESLSYDVYSPQAVSGPPGLPTRMPSFWPPWQNVLKRCSDLPEDDLARLIDLARREAGVTDNGASPADPEKVRRLVSYLRDSAEFSYSLNASVQDTGIDPVEDFLFNRKTGHCEYYASALALMLRAVDIPSRLVSGFKGGYPNQFNGTFVVEQRHAHTWVEAYMNGRWVTLDATPSFARNESVESMGSVLPSWNQLVDFMTETWTSQVVNIDFNKQRENVYDPLVETFREWTSRPLFDTRIWSQWLQGLRDFVRSPRRWFSWQGAGFTFVLLSLLCLLVWLARRAARLVRRILARARERNRRKRMQVEFYERFQKICAARGLRRDASQTQHEFAETVHRQFNGVLQRAGLDAFPFELVDAFYQTRFGLQPLPQQRAAEIEHRLAEFQQCLENRNRK